MTAQRFRPDFPGREDKVEGGFSDRITTVEGINKQRRSRAVAAPVCASGIASNGIQPLPDGYV